MSALVADGVRVSARRGGSPSAGNRRSGGAPDTSRPSSVRRCITPSLRSIPHANVASGDATPHVQNVGNPSVSAGRNSSRQARREGTAGGAAPAGRQQRQQDDGAGEQGRLQEVQRAAGQQV